MTRLPVFAVVPLPTVTSTDAKDVVARVVVSRSDNQSPNWNRSRRRRRRARKQSRGEVWEMS